MKKKFQKVIAGCLAAACCLATFGACGAQDDAAIILKEVNGKAKNVILLIGDGMGPVQMRAGELERGKPLAMQQFPYSTKVETLSHGDVVTDSAAAATALATGTRTTNGYVGIAPNLTELETIMDIAHSLGKRTGVLATEEITGATPMCFLSHASNRGNELGLVQGASEGTVDLVASYTVGPVYKEAFETGGYTVKYDVDEISEATETRIFGSYQILAGAESMSSNYEAVAFDRLVWEALEYLSKDEDGFVLMAEGSHIDHGGHNNDIEYTLEELLAFDDAVRAAVKWAKDRDDTVIIVTADHETGGLSLPPKATKETMYDQLIWTSTGHTATDVYCLINGANIDFSQYSFGTASRIKNTDIFQIMKSLITE